ncbi:hypothetical protein [Microbacterium paraoxydans]|uniref:Uncharacterized protein n=1 Tax=Microbacterium paraoxydans TaxID=199592 RepID=A0ABS5ILF3_9MICO|nr:hypothetical protein [Microbacterium paraoxydans]MBS0023791.1 hypothetical protein [Microbacterium paraoxydans]
MSPEILAVVVSAIGIVLTLGTSLFGAMTWVVRRIDARVDGLDEKLSRRIDAVAADVTELKISVARLEGPPRHLLTARN